MNCVLEFRPNLSQHISLHLMDFSVLIDAYVLTVVYMCVCVCVCVLKDGKI